MFYAQLLGKGRLSRKLAVMGSLTRTNAREQQFGWSFDRGRTITRLATRHLRFARWFAN
jgi:hypothetical protein